MTNEPTNPSNVPPVDPTEPTEPNPDIEPDKGYGDKDPDDSVDESDTNS